MPASLSIHWDRQAATFAIVAGLFVAACGGAPEVQDPRMPGPYRTEAVAFEIDDVELHEDLALSTALSRVRDGVESYGFTTYEADMTGLAAPATGFTRYFTFQEEVPGGRDIHHVVFVAVSEWTPDHIDRFLQTFFAMPSATPFDAGTPYFHIASLHEVPFELSYVFGNSWYGTLESALLLEFSESDGTLEAMDRYRSVAIGELDEVGFEVSEEHPLESLQQLLRQLPSPPTEAELDFHPAGTTLAIGLLFGDALIAEFPELAWISGDDAMSSSFGLAVTTQEDTILRPIEFVQQAYRSTSETPLTDYRDLIRRRLRSL